MRVCFVIGSMAIAMVLAGCGGGGGTESSTPGPSTGLDFAAGELVGRAAISNPPVTTNSPYVAATALTGTISSLKLRELNPSLNETRIIFANDVTDQADLFSCAPDGTDVQRLTTAPFIDAWPSMPANGSKIYFGSTRDAGDYEIYSMNPDGTGQTRLTNHAGVDAYPSVSASGAKLAFLSDRDGTQSAHVMDTSSLNVTQVNADTAYWIAISPDGSKVYTVSSDDGGYKLGVSPAAGGPTNYFKTGLGSVSFLAVSPDGAEIAYDEVVGGFTKLRRMNLSSGLTVTSDLPGTTSSMAYSPDGKLVIVSASDGHDYGLYTVPAGGTASKITGQLTDSYTPFWAPPQKERTLIAGGGGILGTRAVGLVYGQRGAATTSVLAFDATTPSSVVMTKQTGLDTTSPNLVFSCDADSITKMAFANSKDWKGVRIIGSSTPVLTASGALISMDSFTGQIVSILPFTGTRASGSKPTVHDEGSVRIFQGQFPAVYDAKGTNLAPSGASTVRLNTKTGAITIG